MSKPLEKDKKPQRSKGENHEISENWMEEVDRQLGWFERLVLSFLGLLFIIDYSRVAKLARLAHKIVIYGIIAAMSIFLLFFIFLLISLRLSGN